MDNCFKCFDLIDYFLNKYQIAYNPDDKYFTGLKNLKNYVSQNDVCLTTVERNTVIDYVLSLQIPCLKQNVFKILYPCTNIPECFDCDIKELDDSQLLKYLFYVLMTISYNQNGNLLLVKYNVAIWNTGFHSLAKLCRGKVFDMNTKKIVSYPFDKFFNLNEVNETKVDIIKNYISNSSYVYATDKIDGSLIAVSLYNGKPIITTNGSFDNEQIGWAKELFENKYNSFFNNMKQGFTYIFELIHPENRIVLDYHGEKSLYLLAVRDLKTKKLLSIPDVHLIATEYDFPVPSVYNFNDLDTMIHLAHTMSNANKEGWVIRIGVGDNEYIVKLKLDEYFSMHKNIDKIRLGWVYKHILNNDLDDFLSLCTEEQKVSIFKKIDIISSVRNKIKQKAIDEANICLSNSGVTLEDFLKNKSIMIRIINQLLSSKSNVKYFAVQYLKNPYVLDSAINKIFLKNMKTFFIEFGENVNE